MDKIIEKYFKKEELIPYGNFYKVNVPYKPNANYNNKKLILVTSLNPTLSGEGKTTTLIGLNDCLNYFNQKAIGILRQPSMGPYFGRKGGATGGGECRINNDLEVNCGLTNDFYKIEQANNLIMSMIENEIYFKSKLNIDYNTIFWNRCVDLNDRSLKQISYHITKDILYNTSFSITAASHLMALICLVKNESDLRQKLDHTIIAFDQNQNPIYLKELQITNALMVILKDALKPNIVFSKYQNLVLMHGGPFANIAHGCNSLISTYVALNKADYVFCEAGFGSDLGAEKFFNIKCRIGNLIPSLVVLTISLKAVKHHSLSEINDWKKIVESGFEMVQFHYNNLKRFNANVVILINQFNDDKPKELAYLKELCTTLTKTEIGNMYQKGPAYSKNIFNLIVNNAYQRNKIEYTYNLNEPFQTKIAKIIKNIYQAKAVEYEPNVLENFEKYVKYVDNFYICNAKTPFSITADQKQFGVVKDFKIKISDLKINFATNFIIPILSKTFLMPGLNSEPNVKKMKAN